eukprot:TRINITY_DN12324_c0_g1_i1.p1 TRINITY_DN12324_c0_g1~~TRINITY_DN12324_c0_g1_i1.p1  ORF type:complete len:169 (+),score=62.15 TRINITY_DN12324_c0_g1_i1:27-509(+)
MCIRDSYVPAIAGYIMKNYDPDIKLKGLLIANGLMNSMVQLPFYPNFLYENGLISLFSYWYYQSWTVMCRMAISLKINVLDFPCANLFNMYQHAKLTKDPYDVQEEFGGVYDPFDKVLSVYLNKPEVLEALGVRIKYTGCLLYTSPSPRDLSTYRMPSSA